MRISRWAAVAVLAPIGLVSLLHLHQFVSTRSASTLELAGETRKMERQEAREFQDGVLASRRSIERHRTASPLSEERGAAAGPALASSPGEPPRAEEAAPPGLPSVLSKDWARGKFARFSHDELAAMAARCELRWRMPPFSSTALPAFLDEHERAIYLDALTGERARYTRALRELAGELSGEEGPVELRALEDVLRTHPDATPTEIHGQLARARAGGSAVEDRGVYARYLQATITEGDAFEEALAATLDRARARALREGAGPRYTLTGCDPEEAMFRSER